MKKKDRCTNVREVIERNTGMAAAEFLFPRKDYDIHNLKNAKVMLAKALHNGTFIFIMSDYDVDGVASGCIFELLFRSAGYKNYRIRFPKRFSEGYGIRDSIVDEISTGQDVLLITVDNGITALSPIRKAKERGIQTMVLDHHNPVTDPVTGEIILPEADLIVDQHAFPGQGFDGYCGAGLAYKLCSAFIRPGHPVQEKMLGFAAMATIADVMPLVHDNRTIVTNGLKALTKYRTSGTEELLKTYAMDRYLTAPDIGYYIGPSINAMSRMNDDGARMAFETLIYDGSTEKARELAEKMHSTNQQRKKLTEESLESINSVIKEEGLDQWYPMCVYQEGLHEGLIGILAGELVKSYKRPVLVFTYNPEGFLKGSGRSFQDINLYALLHACGDLFLKWGGHAEAAGMSIVPEKLPALREALAKAFEEQGCPKDVPEETYDLDVTMEQLPEVCYELAYYRPFGQGNPPVRLLVRDFCLDPKPFLEGKSIKLMGKEGHHIKLFGKDYDAIAFGKAEKYQNLSEPEHLDLLCTVGQNHYVNKRSGVLTIKDQLECEDIFLPGKE